MSRSSELCVYVCTHTKRAKRGLVDELVVDEDWGNVMYWVTLPVQHYEGLSHNCMRSYYSALSQTRPRECTILYFTFG